MADVKWLFTRDNRLGGPLQEKFHLTYDTFSTYYIGNEGWSFSYDTAASAHGYACIFFDWDIISIWPHDRMAKWIFNWDLVLYNNIIIHMDVDLVEYDHTKYEQWVFSWEVIDSYRYIVYLDTDEAEKDKYTDEARICSWLYAWDNAEGYRYTQWFQWATDAGKQWCYLINRDDVNFVAYVLLLQPSIYFDYTATLIDTVTSEEQTVVGVSEMDLISTFTSTVTATINTEYQVDLATVEQHYGAGQGETSFHYTSWRYLQHENVQYRHEPKISVSTVNSGPSSSEVIFSAVWPYSDLSTIISAYALAPENNGDFFDLGIWLSDTLAVDTSVPPLLTLPWDSGTTDYAAHVPKQGDKPFIAIAPIRVFPTERVGFLTVIPAPT